MESTEQKQDHYVQRRENTQAACLGIQIGCLGIGLKTQAGCLGIRKACCGIRVAEGFVTEIRELNAEASKMDA